MAALKRDSAKYCVYVCNTMASAAGQKFQKMCDRMCGFLLMLPDSIALTPCINPHYNQIVLPISEHLGGAR